MLARNEKYSTSFFVSLLFHGLMLALLILSFSFSGRMPVVKNSEHTTQVINAMVMDMPLKSAPVTPRALPPPLAQPTPKAQDLPAKMAPVKPLPPQAIAISTKKQKKLRQDKIAQALLFDIKKQTEQQKKLKQKALAAAFAKDMKQLAAKSLQHQMLQEQKRVAGARMQEVKGVVNKYQALILQTISQNWLIPPAVDKNLRAKLLIRLAPGGIVLDVKVVQSSGEESLDQSARMAVLKSSPLPVPADPDAFDSFRQFILKVSPKNVLNAESFEM